MSNTLDQLPAELVSAILAHLPIADILSFSATSRIHQEIGHRAISTLRLAVLPREVHCQLALAYQHDGNRFIDDVGEKFLNTSISKATNISTVSSQAKHPNCILEKHVEEQNRIAAEILEKQSLRHLKSLSLYMYGLQSMDLATTIARKLPSLQNLELKFSNPFLHDPSLPPNYWGEVPGGHPCWNPLVGLGGDNSESLRLRNLQHLKIERAGLTSVQLRRIVESNPRLCSLSLHNVAGVDLEFANWLAMYCETSQSRLRTVNFEACPRLQMQRVEDFAWLAGITESNVRHLSLWKCWNVRHQMLVDLIESGEGEGFELESLEKLVPPRGPARVYGQVIPEPAEKTRKYVIGAGTVPGQPGVYNPPAKIEVDPAYASTPLVAAAS